MVEPWGVLLERSLEMLEEDTGTDGNYGDSGRTDAAAAAVPEPGGPHAQTG